MPPRRSAKRSKREPRENVSTSKSTKAAEDAQTTGPVNATGLLALPVEVFARIQDELLEGSRLITNEDVMTGSTHFVADSFHYRADILRPLTQVCRVLQNLYLAEVYEHMEACILRGKKQWYKYLGDRLERMSDRCERELEFAKRVRVVTVSLTRYSTDTVLPAFAEGLAHMPNLHTLRIVFAHRHMMSVLKEAFEGKRYPQIRTIILPTCAHNILRACPNVVDVTCNHGDGSQLVSAMAQVCKKVEVMEGFALYKQGLIKRLPKSVPKLRKLTLGEYSELKDIGKLPSLSELIFKIYVYTIGPEHVKSELTRVIKQEEWRTDQGLAIIRNSGAPTPKSLTVIFLVCDYDSYEATRWNGAPWKVGHTIKVIV